jgi:hypothetical protein
MNTKSSLAAALPAMIVPQLSYVACSSASSSYVVFGMWMCAGVSGIMSSTQDGCARDRERRTRETVGDESASLPSRDTT